MRFTLTFRLILEGLKSSPLIDDDMILALTLIASFSKVLIEPQGLFGCISRYIVIQQYY